MPGESEFMLGLAAAVADGTAIDWTRAEAQAKTDEDRRVLRSLRLVAEIGTVHDSIGDDEAPSSTSRTSPSDPSDEDEPADVPAIVSAPLEQWGRYELREELGAGAQGAVYRAWDPQLECEVALKVLQPRLAATDRVGERMLREGRALARVRHQNVVNVYAAEEHEGQVGLCMEFIKGRTLEEIVRAQGPFGQGEVVTVGSKIGHALAAVHAAGIIHRDVKARNVMREDRGRIVLMDFGTGRDGAQLAATGAGDLAGTPLYMAPEVLAGAAASVQSDIYSVGVLLYYLLTGQHPVEGRTLDEIIQEHVRGRRKPLAERRPDLRDDFLRVIDRALAPDPDARYDSAALLVHDLVSLDAADAANAAPRTITQRILLAAAWLALTALGVGLLGFVTSMAFNVTLERMSVAGETPRAWFGWGVRAALVALVDLQYVFRVALVVGVWIALRRLVPAFDRLAARFDRQVGRLARRLRLWDPDSYGVIVFGLALAFLIIVLWTHALMVSAVMTTVSNMTDAQRGALCVASPFNAVDCSTSPAAAESYYNYRLALEVLVCLGVLASWRLVRLRRQQQTTYSTALLTALVSVVVLAVIMWVAPWRLVMQSERPVLTFDSHRCYDLGRERSQLLLYCPDGAPRIQRVADQDPRLRDTGAIAGVFSTR
ncbi:MAG: serine/threonine-protein kinase [Vicinamibacterales bacterium]